MAQSNSADGRILAWLIGLTEKDQVKRVVIRAFVVFHLMVIVSVSIPPNFFLVTAFHAQWLLTALAEKLAPYAKTAGLQVSWSMFAPNPSRDNAYVDAEITYRNGRKQVWSFPQMQELGYLERYVKERYRKFAAERLWAKENSALWPDAASYIARLNSDATNPPQTVKLVHYRFVIPPLPPPGEAPPSERMEREVFFVYTVKPDDLP